MSEDNCTFTYCNWHESAKQAARYRWIRATGGFNGRFNIIDEWNNDVMAPDYELDEAIDIEICKSEKFSDCPECTPDGVYADTGEGPFDCYACGKKAKVNE